MNPNKKNIEIIKQFNTSPHPEGGWFREIASSENYLLREDGQIRNFITGIYYLLERDAKSAGAFTLVSCCVGPGFDFKDFELLRNTNHTSRLDKAINDLI